MELKEIFKEPEISLLDANSVQKNNYDHFMLKEIHEEPQVVMDTIHSIMPNDVSDLSNAFPNLEKIQQYTHCWLWKCNVCWNGCEIYDGTICTHSM